MNEQETIKQLKQQNRELAKELKELKSKLQDSESEEYAKRVKVAWNTSTYSIARSMKAFVVDCPSPTDLSLLPLESWQWIDEIERAYREFGRVIAELERIRDTVDAKGGMSHE